MARNYYYRSDRRRDPKLVNVIAVPSGVDVYAVYSEQDGRELRAPVFLIGVYEDGELRFIEAGEDGIFDCPETAQNFIRYEFQKR